MKVTIRSATADDVPSLGILRGQAIEAACSDTYDRGAYADLVANPMGDLSTWIDADSTTVLVAETEITPVAYVAVKDETGEILSIATNTAYQREGFGTVLLDRLAEHARETGLTQLHVNAPSVAVPFFEAAGFQQDGDADWHGLPATRMVKPLVE